MKPARGQAVTKIQRRAAQISGALVIDEKLHAVALDHFIAVLFFVERHLIIQTRATALVDLHAQTFPGALLLGIEQHAELAGRTLGDGYHRRANYGLTVR